MKSHNEIRWGILGAAQIARKNWKAIRLSGNGRVVAVASRDKDRSLKFIGECQEAVPFPECPKALGNYESLVDDPDIDAVYIPLPTGVRKEWVIRAAEAGKHVVVEKPCAVRMEDLVEMTDACRRNRVQFMDGVMFMHSGRLVAVKEALRTGIGRIRRMASAFSFCGESDFLNENIRMHRELEPHGCMGDLGWYCIRFMLWVMDWKMPREVTGRLLAEAGRGDSPHPVPTEFSGEMYFDDAISGTFYCSFLNGDQQWAHVSGTAGHVVIPDFVLPYRGSELSFTVRNPQFEVEGCEFNMEPRARSIGVNEFSNGHESAQEVNLFRNFSSQVQSGELNEEWPMMALKTQEVMEQMLSAAAGRR